MKGHSTGYLATTTTDKQGHKKVTEIMNKYFRNLELKEKRRIRNEYDDVREYVYYKYLSTI